MHTLAGALGALVLVVVLVVALDLGGRPANAEPEASVAGPCCDDEPANLVVAEAFGKLGLYGLGYERALTARLSLGVAGAFYVASGRRVLATSAYLGVGGAISGPHRWFAQLGPELVHEREPAVAGFAGASSTAAGLQLTAGYEYRRSRWLARGHAVVTAGRGGVAPWAGSSIGVRF